MGYKILSILLSLVLVFALVGCTASDGEDSGESTVGKIELPVWPEASVTSAPGLPVSSTESETTSGLSSAAPVSEGPTTSNYTEYTENSANAPDINNITICTAQSYYSTTDRSIQVKISNRTGWQIGYKRTYTIEKWENEGWSQVPMVEDADFGNEGFILGTGMDSYVELDLTLLEAPLSMGRYRVGLTDMICNGYSGMFVLYTEFSVK